MHGRGGGRHPISGLAAGFGAPPPPTPNAPTRLPAPQIIAHSPPTLEMTRRQTTRPPVALFLVLLGARRPPAPISLRVASTVRTRAGGRQAGRATEGWVRRQAAEDGGQARVLIYSIQARERRVRSRGGRVVTASPFFCARTLGGRPAPPPGSGRPPPKRITPPVCGGLGDGADDGSRRRRQAREGDREGEAVRSQRPGGPARGRGWGGCSRRCRRAGGQAARQSGTLSYKWLLAGPCSGSLAWGAGRAGGFLFLLRQRRMGSVR
jgi:hypothetical protein